MTSTLAHRRTTRPWRFGLALAIAVAAGVAVAFVDSRPGWDDTGVTVMSLAGAAFLATLVAGRRPWLFAILVGIWTPIVEIPGGQMASLAALVFAAAGAGIAAVLTAASRQA